MSKKDSKNKNSKTKKVKKGSFFKQVKKEMTLVKWPSGKEVIKYSISTIVFCLFICAFFLLLNAIMSLITGWI